MIHLAALLVVLVVGGWFVCVGLMVVSAFIEGCYAVCKESFKALVGTRGK